MIFRSKPTSVDKRNEPLRLTHTRVWPGRARATATSPSSTPLEGVPRVARPCDAKSTLLSWLTGKLRSSSVDQAAGSSTGRAEGCLVGSRRVSNRASTARTASRDSEARNPSMRALAFSATMASAVLGGTPALSSSVFKSSSEMNGTPPGQFHLGLGGHLGRDRRVVGDAAQERRGQRRDEHRPGQGGTDRGAQVGHGVLDAADFAAVLVGHRRDGHAAQLGGQGPHTESGQQHGPGHDLRSGAGVEGGHHDGDPGEQGQEPQLGDPARGEASGNTFGTPTAASSRVIDRGRSRTPVAMADRPSATDKQRHREEQAGLEQVLEEKGRQPAAKRPVAQQGRVEQRRLPQRRRGS